MVRQIPRFAQSLNRKWKIEPQMSTSLSTLERGLIDLYKLRCIVIALSANRESEINMNDWIEKSTKTLNIKIEFGSLVSTSSQA